jgi:hypothetical protein
VVSSDYSSGECGGEGSVRIVEFYKVVEELGIRPVRRDVGTSIVERVLFVKQRIHLGGLVNIELRIVDCGFLVGEDREPFGVRPIFLKLSKVVQELGIIQ